MIPSDVKDFLLKAAKHYQKHEGVGYVEWILASASMPKFLMERMNSDDYKKAVQWLERQEVQPPKY